MKKISNKYFSFYIPLFLILLFTWSIFGYVQVELNTYLFAKNIPTVEKLCKDNSLEADAEFRYFKILFYNKGLETSSVYCIFTNSDLNLRLDINKNKEWRVVFTSQLNKDRSWYWPLYF